VSTPDTAGNGDQTHETPAIQDAEETSPVSLFKAWYLVGILMVIYVFSFMDRSLLGLLVGPIKESLGITDFEISLLMGFSFALFYSTLGLPIGRLADSKNRKWLIAIGLFIWTLMTALCGTVRTFWQFFLCRVGLGVGEATLSPSAYSMITDVFPKRRLATAISAYSMGIYIGSAVSGLGGAFVLDMVRGYGSLDLPLVGTIHPWQVLFLVVGLLGFIPLLVFIVTVREPARRRMRTAARTNGQQKKAQASLRETLAYMRANARSIFHHNVGFSILAFSNWAIGSWILEFFVRTHGWDRVNTGYLLGVNGLIVQPAAILFGGYLADRMIARGKPDGMMRVGLIGALGWLGPGLFYTWMPYGWLSFLLVIPVSFFVALPFGCAPAAMQQIMPADMRAQAAAWYLFIVNLIGMGIGPSAIAFCTDFVFRDESMLWASILLVGSIAHVAAAVAFWRGLAPFRESVARIEAYNVSLSFRATLGRCPAVPHEMTSRALSMRSGRGINPRPTMDCVVGT
jgi:MFS family permease